jgi:hypothetical protein
VVHGGVSAGRESSEIRPVSRSMAGVRGCAELSRDVLCGTMKSIGVYRPTLWHERSKRTSPGGLHLEAGRGTFGDPQHVETKMVHDTSTITHLSTHHEGTETVSDSCPHAHIRPQRPSAQPESTVRKESAGREIRMKCSVPHVLFCVTPKCARLEARGKVWVCVGNAPDSGRSESIRHGEGRSRPGLRVLRGTAFEKVKLS